MLRTARICHFFFGVLLITAAIPASVRAQAKTPSTQDKTLPTPTIPNLSAETDVLDRQALSSDSRLSRVFNLTVRGAEIEKILAAVSAQTGIKLSIAGEAKDRRYTGIMRRGTILNFMDDLARTCRMSWRKMPPTPENTSASETEYQLFQTEEQKRQEQRSIAASEHREKNYRDELRNGLQAALRKAQAGGDPEAGTLPGFLSAYSPEQLDRTADSALEPADIIAADNQSHFHRHFFYSTPFSQLTAGQQDAVRAILTKEQYHPTLSGSPTPNVAGTGSAGVPLDFSRMQVGLIAACGGFRLGVIEPDGKDVWVSAGIHIGNAPPLDPQAAENDFDPAIDKMLRSDKIVDLSAMPPSLRNRMIRFPASLSRDSLSEFLGYIAEQTGLSVSCDDFLNSRVTNYPNILPDTEEFTVEQALRQIARTFAHRIIYAKGCLYADTLTLGLDLRLEPSATIMARLGELQAGKVKPDLNDLLMFGECTRPQVNCILRNHPVKRTWGGLLFRAVRYHTALHLCARLTPQESAAAEGEEGLRFEAMTTGQKDDFRLLTDSGLPTPEPAENSLKARRLYIRRNTAASPTGPPARPVLVLMLTGPGEPPSQKRIELR